MAAEEIQIAGSQEIGKLRNPVTTALLTLIPFYGLFWYYYVNKEMAAIGQARGTEEAGTDPTKSLLALIPGGLIVVPALLSFWNSTKRLAAVERLTGQTGMAPVGVFLLMLFLLPVGAFLFQSSLTKALQAQAGVAPAQVAQPA